MTKERLHAALRYAVAGVPVFPCVPDGKRPLVRRGLYAATTDSRVIRAWWSTWPDANLAMPTGQPGGRPTFDVVDVDLHTSGSGYEHVDRLRDAGLLDGWTHEVQTPSGGMHIYFPGTGQRNGSVAGAHIDFRADGGYVLIPPSTTDRPGGPVAYTMLRASSHPAAPVSWDAIRDELAPSRHSSGVAFAPAVPQHATPERVAAWLARYVARTPEHSRNNVLYWASCRAAEHGVSDPQPLLQAALQAGLSEHEAGKTIQSAYRRIRQDRQRPGPPARDPWAVLRKQRFPQTLRP